MADEAKDLAQHVATNVAALTYGTNCFAGPERPADDDGNIPQKCVFMFESGGQAPFEMHASGRIRYPSVLIRVRGNKDAFDDTRTLANAVLAAAHVAEISGYMNILIEEAAPVSIGGDEQGLPLFAMVAEMWKEEA